MKSSAIVYVLSGVRLLRTDDSGAHFTDVAPPGLNLPCDAAECYRSPSDIILDEGDPLRVFAMVMTSATPFVPYLYMYQESRDRGATWVELPGRFPRQRLYPDPNDAKVLYLAGTGGVRKSRDGGQTWFDVVSGLDDYSVCKLHVSRQTPGIVYATTCADDRPQGGLTAVPEAGYGPLYWTTTGGE